MRILWVNGPVGISCILPKNPRQRKSRASDLESQDKCQNIPAPSLRRPAEQGIPAPGLAKHLVSEKTLGKEIPGGGSVSHPSLRERACFRGAKGTICQTDPLPNS